MRISDWSSDVCSSDLQRVEDDAVDRLSVLDQRDRNAPVRPAVEVVAGAVQRVDHPGAAAGAATPLLRAASLEIGRESGRESGLQYCDTLVVAVSLEKKRQSDNESPDDCNTVT